MWRSRRDRILTDKVLPSAGTSRDLARHAISLGRVAQVSGDKQGAKMYYEAAMNLGRCLSKPERLAAAHLVGKAIVAMADEQLSTLDETVRNSEGH